MRNSFVRRVFWWLIGVDIVFYASLILLPLVDHAWLTQKELDVLSYVGYGARFDMPMLVWRGFTIIWFPIMVGMIVRWYWARVGLLLWLTASIGLTIFGGLVTKSALGAALSHAGYVVDGAIVAMAFFSSVASDFER